MSWRKEEGVDDILDNFADFDELDRVAFNNT